MTLSPKVEARLAEIEQRWNDAPAGPWREATGYGGIVSDHNTGWDDPDNVEAYGGYLVCESVAPPVRPALVHAPSDVAFLLSLVRGGTP